MMTTDHYKLTDDDKRVLGELTTKDDAGRHFTATHSTDWVDKMEAAGYITIDRPVHRATGIPYSQEHWTVEVAAEVADWFDSDGELIDADDAPATGDDDTIDCDGPYEVHPGAIAGDWAVVNSATGRVRQICRGKQEAIRFARELNEAEA